MMRRGHPAYVCLVAAALAFGCSDRDMSRGNPVLSEDAGPSPSEPGDGSGPERPEGTGVAELENLARGDAPQTDVLAVGVLGMLEAACGACHVAGTPQGAFAGLLDVPGLIAQGLIVPGSSAMSPLLSRIVDGSMPPGSSRPVPTAGEAALLATFIDHLPTTPTPACDALPFVSEDAVYATLLADIASQPAEDRPFLRYLGITYASNAGLCGPALEQQRLALFKAINSVSREPAISVPVAIDAAQLLYRVDIRKYGWSRPIDLDDDGVANFADAWRAIEAGAGPYAAEMTGPDADVARQETTAAVPLLPVNVFVDAVSQGDLYYSLVGVGQNLFDTQLALGADVYTLMDQGAAQRAGFTAERAGGYSEFTATRVEQSVASGRYFWMLEPQQSDDSESIYSNPLGFDRLSGLTIFQLPNGLQAYAADGADGTRLGRAPADCASRCDHDEALNAAACHGCHAAGLVVMRDEVRNYVETNQGLFDRQTFADVQATYPPAAELETLFAADSASHQAALAQAGVPEGQPDPLSRVFFQFEKSPLGIDAVAAELGVTTEALREGLPRLPWLSALAESGATIDRGQLGLVWRATRCELLGSARNRPLDCP